MANATAGPVQAYTRDYDDAKIKVPMAALGAGVKVYPGAMIGINAAGYGVKMDDTAKFKFAGIMCEHHFEFDGSETDGSVLLDVEQPLSFDMLIASAAITDFGRAVHARFDNEVQYSSGTYRNVIGSVVQRLSSTRVLIQPEYVGFQASTYQGGIGDHLQLDTWSDDKQVRINSRNFNQATGDSIAFQATPNQAVTTTGEVFGGQIKPRVATGINAATVNGLGIDSELKGPGAGALSSDLRGLNMYLGATGSGTIGGDVVAVRARQEVNINPTGHICLLKPVNHEGSQGWDAMIKFDAALGTHSMTTASDKTGGAKPGTIKVIHGTTLVHIQLYAD